MKEEQLRRKCVKYKIKCEELYYIYDENKTIHNTEFWYWIMSIAMQYCPLNGQNFTAKVMKNGLIKALLTII